jgi:NAD(P)H dehydrogenase (quinone)
MTISHEPTPGAAHWVLAHPRSTSFNARLFRDGVAELSRTRSVATSDLYAQGFDPVFPDSELDVTLGRASGRAGGEYGRVPFPDDVIEEQRKLAAAELLVLQFPLWWYGPPAILKGWIDRVLTNGFAYGDMDPELGVPRRYGDGGLTGRRALVVVTVGEDERSIGERGISGDLDSLLFPLTHGALWYVGIETLDLHVVYDADGLDAAGVDREAERLRARIAGLDSETPRRYRALRDGDYRGTRSLRSDIHPGRTDFGIHLAD